MKKVRGDYILYIPSWYPTADQPFNGHFFADQAAAVSKYNKVIIANVNILSLRLLKNYLVAFPYLFRSSVYKEDNIIKYTVSSLGSVISGRNRHVYVKKSINLVKKIIKMYGLPKVVHCQCSFDAGYVGVWINKRYGTPLVVTEHQSKILRGDLSEVEIDDLKNIYSKCQSIIAVGINLASSLAQYTAKDIKVIPNIVDGDMFSVGHNKMTRFTFVSAGIMRKVKNMNLLIEAFNSLIQSGIECQLILIGDGPERHNLEKKVEELGITQAVKFYGALSRNEIGEVYKSCHCYVSTSAFETFGVAIIEALFSGLPSVCTNSGGPNDYIESYNGLIVQHDVQSVEEGMRSVFENINQYDPIIISNSLKRKYSFNTVGASINKVYNDD